MERFYKVATKVENTEEEVLNYSGYSTESDYGLTDDERERCADPELAFWAWNTK